MVDNPLLIPGANAVIAGGGAIGTAFANQLAARPGVARPGVARPGVARPGAARPEVGRVIMLARRKPQGLDARVEVVPLEATDPGS
jgi:hypothetical protein